MSPDARFEEIAAELTPRGAAAGAMFGKRALKAHADRWHHYAEAALARLTP